MSDPGSEIPKDPENKEKDQLPAVTDPSNLQRQVKDTLEAALKKVGLELPPEKSRTVVRMLSRRASSFFRGPMPPPAVLKDYDKALPGLAKQIADMALSEQRHRHRWELAALSNTIFTQSGGLLLGWLLAGGCVASYVGLIANGFSVWAAAPLLGPPLLTIVRTMLPSKQTTEGGASNAPAISHDTPEADEQP